MEDRMAQNKWVRALWEPLAGIKTTKRCISLGDVHGDNDYKLLLVDESEEKCRLRLFKGLTPVVDSPLTEVPAGIATVVCDSNECPCVAVPSGASLLIYRNMKPYYRYNLPQLDLNQMEVELWNRTKNKQLTTGELCEGLKVVCHDITMKRMSFHSQILLSQTTDEARDRCVAHLLTNVKDNVPLSNIKITCISTIKRHTSHPSAVDVIIVGTEIGSVYWIDTQAFTVLANTALPSTPVQMISMGLYDLESRVAVLTRDSDVYILKKNSRNERSQTMVLMRTHLIAGIVAMNQFVFASRDQKVFFYSSKGKRVGELKFEEDVADVEPFGYEPRQYSGVLVAVKNEVRLYMDQMLVDTIKLDNRVEWIKYGQIGREEGGLVIGLEGGGMCVKIFRRTAQLGEKPGPPVSAMNLKLNIPKRTKEFVQQSLRERENPQRMHKIYQRDLFLMKYNTTKTYAQLVSGATGLAPVSEAEPIEFSIDVLGFGPVFRLIVKMISATPVQPAKRMLTFIYNSEEYSFAQNIVHVPPIVPMSWLSFAVDFTCLHPEKGLQEEARVLLVRSDWKRPVWMASFKMPLSEQNIL